MNENKKKRKVTLRSNYRFYNQELLNHLFKQPYPKIKFLQNEFGVIRITATSYLKQLVDDNILVKHKLGKTNYYINTKLMDALLEC
jgi:Fic family protein